MLTIVFFMVAAALRLVSVSISRRNEKALRAGGATEYGARTSLVLALAHVVFYLAAFAESLWRAPPPSWITVAGLAIYALSMAALFWVIGVLGRLWTVKLLVARDHRLVTNRMFRLVRHPNYFLNIVPELVGLAMVLQAWVTLSVGLPLYLVVLALRIREEEGIMRKAFPGY